MTRSTSPARSRSGALSTLARADVPVRMRCRSCEVAWTGADDSTCWICSGEGESVTSLVRFYDTDDPTFDFTR